MTKEKILNGIIKNKPDPFPPPYIPDFPVPSGDMAETFKISVEHSGGQCFFAQSIEALENIIHQLFPQSNHIVATLSESGFYADISPITSVDELKNVDVAIIPSSIGVVENGACWINDEDSGHRILPFITQHLVVVLREDQLVSNMHQAYAGISPEHGFGVFIAGPSKTADIEQALVVGAQAARSLTVFILMED